MDNTELLKTAKRAVEQLFSDTSVDRDRCRENLDEIEADINSYRECLDEDDARDAAA